MAHIGWLGQEHKRSFFFPSNPYFCNTKWNFLFCNILNEKFFFISCCGIHRILSCLDEHMCFVHLGMASSADFQKLWCIY